MNIYQRIVLVLGALALVIGIWTVPKYVSLDGKMKMDAGKLPGLTWARKAAQFTNLGSLTSRSVGIVGVTLALFFALKGLKSPTSFRPIFRIVPAFLKRWRFWKGVALVMAGILLLAGISILLLSTAEDRRVKRSSSYDPFGIEAEKTPRRKVVEISPNDLEKEKPSLQKPEADVDAIAEWHKKYGGPTKKAPSVPQSPEIFPSPTQWQAQRLLSLPRR